MSSQFFSMFRRTSLVLVLLVSGNAALGAGLQLHVSPASRLLTEEASVIVGGAPPGAEITLEATMTDRGGQAWSSRGVYYASREGFVDTSKAASVSGTYRGVDGEGLFWSMLPMPAEMLTGASIANAGTQSARRIPDFDSWNAGYDLRKVPVKVRIRARVSGALASAVPDAVEATQSIHFVAAGVGRIPISEEELRGVLFVAPGEGPHPLVLVVTGSGGGAYEGVAALLASHGITAMALAHFNYPGRPDQLINLPLEYFQGAMRWLADRYGQQRVALFGVSRGGEGVLLIASTFPEQVSAVIAGVPSNMVFAGCCTADLQPAPAWTLNGEPLPYVPWFFNDIRPSDIWNNSQEARDIYLRDMVAHDFDDSRWIPVENIRAPILLVSGEADAIWPSNIASQRVLERLAAKNFAYPAHHLEYAGAGHAVNFPMLVKSLADRGESDQQGFALSFGGTPAHNAHAQSDAFHRMIEFIRLYESEQD